VITAPLWWHREDATFYSGLGGPTTTDGQCTVLSEGEESLYKSASLPHHLYTGGLRLRLGYNFTLLLKPRYVETQSSEGSKILFYMPEVFHLGATTS